MGTLLYPLFSAWKAKAEGSASLALHRGPLDHMHALSAAFPELYSHAGQVSTYVCSKALREVARFEGGEPSKAIFATPRPSNGRAAHPEREETNGAEAS